MKMGSVVRIVQTALAVKRLGLTAAGRKRFGTDTFNAVETLDKELPGFFGISCATRLWSRTMRLTDFFAGERRRAEQELRKVDALLRHAKPLLAPLRAMFRQISSFSRQDCQG
jgi:hypothetical protein